MLLSYTEICELIEQGVVVGAKYKDVNAGSLDIHLGTDILYEQDTDNGLSIVDYRARQKLHMGKHVMDPERGYVLAPRESVLASSEETFNLPNNVCAEYKLKSSMARIFLEHLKAGWCFVGSTGIPLLDGSTVPIASLVGKQFWVYSLDDCGEVVPGFVSRVWETKKVTSTVVVTLDSGDTFECTPDHRIMLRHGGYCEAQHLLRGAALMPFYRKLEQNDHKVVSVQHRRRRTPVPVYDMTVEEHHNFAIAAGVFVHNCDAGWNGSKLTLELCNLSRFHSIRIRPGDAIGQMVFFRHTEVPEDRSYAARGRYNGDTTVSAIKE